MKISDWASLIGSLVGSLIAVVVSVKILLYRVEQLEKKVDKHNSVIERVSLLELRAENIEKRLC